MRAISLTLTTFLAVAGIAMAQVPSNRHDVEDEISEALFRHEIAAAEGKPWAPEVWCIRTPNNEGTSRLVLRLIDIKAPVLNSAECTSDRGIGVRERDSARNGRSLWIKSIGLDSDTAAFVVGGYYVDGTNAAGVLYTLRRDNMRWVVVEGKTQWVS